MTVNCYITDNYIVTENRMNHPERRIHDSDAFYSYISTAKRFDKTGTKFIAFAEYTTINRYIGTPHLTKHFLFYCLNIIPW